MSGGQDPSTWEYEVESADNPGSTLSATVRAYLMALERVDAVEIYRLRKEMLRLVRLLGG